MQQKLFFLEHRLVFDNPEAPVPLDLKEEKSALPVLGSKKLEKYEFEIIPLKPREKGKVAEYLKNLDEKGVQKLLKIQKNKGFVELATGRYQLSLDQSNGRITFREISIQRDTQSTEIAEDLRNFEIIHEKMNSLGLPKNKNALKLHPIDPRELLSAEDVARLLTEAKRIDEEYIPDSLKDQSLCAFYLHAWSKDHAQIPPAPNTSAWKYAANADIEPVFLSENVRFIPERYDDTGEIIRYRFKRPPARRPVDLLKTGSHSILKLSFPSSPSKWCSI